MTTNRHYLIAGLGLGLLLAAASPVWGQQVSNFSFNNLNLAIPDNNPNGVQNSQTISGLSGRVANVQVSLVIAGTGYGAFDSDLYVELVNGAGGFAVLLNRVGMTSANPFGYGDNGFAVTFSDSAAYDIHLYQNVAYNLNSSGQLTGTWQPDGENISPLSAPSAYNNALQHQTAVLGSFDGENPNTTWTLYVADLSAGGTAELINWTLSIETVPEPKASSLFFLGLMACVWRQIKKPIQNK